MQKWVMSASSKVYDHEKAFSDNGYIDWNQTKHFSVGDFVYIYCSKPVSQIKYLTIVEAIDLSHEEIMDDSCYWKVTRTIKKKYMRLRLVETSNNKELCLPYLQLHGMKYAPQSPSIIKPELQIYLDKYFITR